MKTNYNISKMAILKFSILFNTIKCKVWNAIKLRKNYIVYNVLHYEISFLCASVLKTESHHFSLIGFEHLKIMNRTWYYSNRSAHNAVPKFN